jgi:hypothetical protein
MSDLIVNRLTETGDLSVTTPVAAKGINRAMTVAELIEALSHFPPGMLVTRYCDDCVTTVTLEHYGRDEAEYAHGHYPDQLPSADTAHVSLS